MEKLKRTQLTARCSNLASLINIELVHQGHGRFFCAIDSYGTKAHEPILILDENGIHQFENYRAKVRHQIKRTHLSVQDVMQTQICSSYFVSDVAGIDSAELDLDRWLALAS